MIHNLYLTQSSASALLALSRARTTALRKAREHRASLIALGWDAVAANEMVMFQCRIETASAERLVTA